MKFGVNLSHVPSLMRRPALSGHLLGMFGSDTKGDGSFFDVVWYGFSVGRFTRLGTYRPYRLGTLVDSREIKTIRSETRNSGLSYVGTLVKISV